MVYTRYKRIATAMNGGIWKSNAQLIKITNLFVGLWMTSLSIYIFLNSYFELEYLMLYNICTNAGKEIARHIFQVVVFGAYRAILSVLTIAVDIACLFLVRELAKKPKPGTNQAQKEKRNILNETPMRSSLLTLLYFAHVLSIMPIMALESLTNREKIDIALIGQYVLLLIKNPWLVFLTVRVNEVNARVDQNEERERKRQLEIKDAIKRRNERLANHSIIDEQQEDNFQNNIPVKTSSVTKLIYVKEYCPHKSEPSEVILQPLDLMKHSSQ